MNINHSFSVIYFFCSGNWTRTSDLRVMSPTSYLLLYPAISDCKSTIFFLYTKFFGNFFSTFLIFNVYTIDSV